MKKIVSSILALSAASLLAGIMEPFQQFTQADIHEYSKPGQQWTYGSKLITLEVKAGTDVWLSNYVSSFNETILPLDENIFDMSAVRYGYIFKQELPTDDIPNGQYSDKIHWSNGVTNEITYTYDPNPSITNSTTGYFLDHFDQDAELYLVMSYLPSEGGETVDSYQFVNDPDGVGVETSMQSRQHNTLDLAGNVRFNFGIVGEGETGREFVAFYQSTSDPTPSGQPLPGLLFTGLLSLGTVFGASRMKKRS